MREGQPLFVVGPKNYTHTTPPLAPSQSPSLSFSSPPEFVLLRLLPTRCRRNNRACTSWTPAESSVQRKLRSPLSGDTGVVGDPVGRYQGRPPLDQVRALDHGDRQSTEDATFSRLQGIGETQVGGGKSGSTYVMYLKDNPRMYMNSVTAPCHT